MGGGASSFAVYLRQPWVQGRVMAPCCLRLHLFNATASGNFGGKAGFEQVGTHCIWCHKNICEETAPGWNGCNEEWERALPARRGEILRRVCPIVKPRDTKMTFVEVRKYTHTQMIYAWTFYLRSCIPARLFLMQTGGCRRWMVCTKWKPASLNFKVKFTASFLLITDLLSENWYSRPTCWRICFIHSSST